jgi:hypothetical protein
MTDESAGRSLARALAALLRQLTDDDIMALASGKAKLSVVHTETREQVAGQNVTKNLDDVTRRLSQASTRAEALSLLDELLPRREQLRQLARQLDLPLPKSDNMERLKDRIVEGTVGYRLRSDAIRSNLQS